MIVGSPSCPICSRAVALEDEARVEVGEREHADMYLRRTRPISASMRLALNEFQLRTLSDVTLSSMRTLPSVASPR
jgi:hypothetical protein